MNVPSHVTAGDLAEVLLASTTNSTDIAAIRMLAQHGVWLARPEFRDRYICWEVSDGTDGPWACIEWDTVPGAPDWGIPASSSEIAVLNVAHSIFTGPLYRAAIRCDGHNWALIVEAVTAMRGVR